MNEVRAKFDYVFTTGGIGPTHDDITADCIAKAFGVGISEHPEAIARMTRHYGDVALFTPARRRMARVPHGGTLVDNPVSVAPGFQMENVFTFAGIPTVAQGMFQSMKHRLVGGDPVLARTVRTNLPEGIIAEPLGALQNRYADLDIGSYPGFRNGRPSVSLVLRGTDDARLETAAAELIQHDQGDERRSGGVRPVAMPRPAQGAAQWGGLVVLSAALAALLLWVHAPAALMLGPLAAAIIVSSNGAKLRLPLTPFVLAQGIVGCLIAKMVPLSIVGDVLQHWFLFTVGVLAVVAISSALGWLMTRWQMLPGTTALWGTSPGAASVMTIMAESYGADVRLVAFMQYLPRRAGGGGRGAGDARRSASTPPHAPAAIVWFPPVDWLPLGETLALAIFGPLIARQLNIPAGAFLVPMIGGIVLTHLGLMTIELPTWLLAASYALVGWNVGLRFTRPLLIHAARAAAAHRGLHP